MHALVAEEIFRVLSFTGIAAGVLWSDLRLLVYHRLTLDWLHFLLGDSWWVVCIGCVVHNMLLSIGTLNQYLLPSVKEDFDDFFLFIFKTWHLTVVQLCNNIHNNVIKSGHACKFIQQRCYKGVILIFQWYSQYWKATRCTTITVHVWKKKAVLLS